MFYGICEIETTEKTQGVAQTFINGPCSGRLVHKHNFTGKNRNLRKVTKFVLEETKKLEQKTMRRTSQ